MITDTSFQPSSFNPSSSNYKILFDILTYKHTIINQVLLSLLFNHVKLPMCLSCSATWESVPSKT